MIFTDPFFLFAFLPLTCVLFYGARRFLGSGAAMLVLLAASLLFYAPWGVDKLALLVISVAVNFALGSYLLGTPDTLRRRRVAALSVGQTYNLAVLIWFKYQFVQRLAAGGDLTFHMAAIPAGISFYTFHQAAFLTDAYFRDASVSAFFEKSGRALGRLYGFVRYAVFVTFFPQLVIGPITYLKEFQPQVDRPGFGRFRPIDIGVGLAFISIGLFKKVVIADNLALLVDPVFAAAAAKVGIAPAEAVIGGFAYLAQLYFDFSGYSDMALGIARMFGLRYPINFFSPLKAVGIVDYYKRWHMTLTRVISRFLYTPLSIEGTRIAMRRRWSKTATKAIGQWAPLVLNFVVIGLWHGATWPFLLFGLLHGVWYATEVGIRDTKWFKAWKKKTSVRLRTVLGRMIFILPIMLTLAVFRSESAGAALHLFSQMVAGDWGADRLVPFKSAAIMLPLAFGIIYLLPNAAEFLRNYRPAIMTYVNESYARRWAPLSWRPTLAWSLFCAGLVLVALYYIARQPPFLYQGF